MEVHIPKIARTLFLDFGEMYRLHGMTIMVNMLTVNRFVSPQLQFENL